MNRGAHLLNERLRESGETAFALSRRLGIDRAHTSRLKRGIVKPGRVVSRLFKEHLNIDPESWDEER